jgi:hypothetical protein
MAYSHEFRPGHPFAFWLAIVAIVYVMWSGAMAAGHMDDCRQLGVSEQHWAYWPPGWVCGAP